MFRITPFEWMMMGFSCVWMLCGWICILAPRLASRAMSPGELLGLLASMMGILLNTGLAGGSMIVRAALAGREKEEEETEDSEAVSLPYSGTIARKETK
jgi:hypothetical protein